MVEAEHVDEPPCHRAGVGGLASAAQLRYHRPARRRRPHDAHDVERHVVEKPEIGPALAEREMLGQMPVRTQRPHAEFRDAVIVLDAGRLGQ